MSSSVSPSSNSDLRVSSTSPPKPKNDPDNAEIATVKPVTASPTGPPITAIAADIARAAVAAAYCLTITMSRGAFIAATTAAYLADILAAKSVPVATAPAATACCLSATVFFTASCAERANATADAVIDATNLPAKITPTTFKTFAADSKLDLKLSTHRAISSSVIAITNS